MYNVVIVDDEIMICSAIQTVVKSAFPDVHIQEIFQDGDKAYVWLESNQTDILILDIELPARSGLDIAQLVYEQSRGTYVIMISAHQNFNYAKKPSTIM